MGIETFFAPRSIAVVGASTRPESVGHAVMRNLLFGAATGSEDRAAGFQGELHAINPKGGEILGVTANKSVLEIDGDLDVAVMCIPGKFIPDVIDQCAEKGCRSVIVISAGFAEVGEAGKALQDDMVARAKEKGVRLIGPNCLGVMRPSAQMNATFGAGAPAPGGVGLLSQSGALVTGVISYAESERFGLSAAVSLGAKCDVNDVEVLRYLADDDETKSIALYVEAFPDPEAAVEALHYAASKKPVVAIKGGLSGAGAKAASSHTGALAGSGAAYTAAFAQAGVLHAKTIGDFLTWSRTLATQPAAAGKRIAIVTNAGGPGVLSADEADRNGLVLAELKPETLDKLNKVLPSVWSHNNPVDVIGDATPERYKEALNILGAADEVDGIVTIMTQQAMTAPKATAEAIIAAHDDASWKKPLTCSFIGLIGTEVGSMLDAVGIPELNTPEEAVRAMAALVRQGVFERRREAPAVAFDKMPAPDLDKARALIKAGKDKGQSNLDLALARDVLGNAGLRYNRSGTAVDVDEAVKIADEIGYPVVLKLISPDIIHKSDAGGVVLNVATPADVREKCAQIRTDVEAYKAGARITGFTVEEMVSGTEIIVGVSRDPGFGPMMMVGMGGVFVEVYKDVAFRLLPVSRRDALEMIDEIRAQALLDGARGRPVLNRDELAEVCLRISALVEAMPEIKELDVNPFVITEDELVAIDARVIV